MDNKIILEIKTNKGTKYILDNQDMESYRQVMNIMGFSDEDYYIVKQHGTLNLLGERVHFLLNGQLKDIII